MPAKGQFKLNTELVIQTYKELGGNATGAGRKLGASSNSIIRTLRSAGIDTSGRLLPKHIKDEAARLYVEEKLGANEVAVKLSTHPSAISRHIKKLGLSRSTQEAHAISSQRIGRRGRAGWWHSTKTGKWEAADSRYELVRMKQLDEDFSVRSWTRQTPVIGYGDKRYSPDFLITTSDNRTIIEEVKPSVTVQKEMVESGKLKAAQEYCSKNGLEFRIITENEIGHLAIRNFVLDGLATPNEQERILKKKEVDQNYRDKNRERENTRTLAWYHSNRERELVKRRERKATFQILRAWSAAI